MTLRLRLLFWLAPLLGLLVGMMLWLALHQNQNLEFVPLDRVETPAPMTAPAAKVSATTAPSTANSSAQDTPNPFSTKPESPIVGVAPAVPTPKASLVTPPSKTMTLAQLQKRREPALLRYRAGQLEEVRPNDFFNSVQQSSLWLWAIFLLSAALLFGSVGIRRSLVPLERFTADIASRNANRLDAIQIPPLPELKPAVSAFNSLLEDLRSSLARARLQEQSAKRFAYNASHELRNPLTAARNYLEVLERHPGEPQAVKEALEAVRRTEKVLGSLLTLARLEGRGQVTGQTIHLRDFLEANFELPVMGEAQIKADRDLLELALENLIKNATEHGGGAVRFVIEDIANQTWIWLEDAGIGFQPTLLSSAFEPFVKRGNGTGLGLAIVAAIAEVHGGSCQAENQDQGARVGIGFPKT